MRADGIFAIIALAGVGLGFATPSRAQSNNDQPAVFGQPMSQHYLVNRLMGPSQQERDAAAAAGTPLPAPEDDGPGPFPRRYLFNKLFDSGAAPEGAAKTP